MSKRRMFGRDPEVHEHDLGLSHDMKTMSRRGALALFGAAGATAALAACGSPSSTSTTASSSATAGAGTATSTADAVGECVAAAPGETAGPYPGDGSNGPNVLVESGIVRKDITSSFGTSTGTAEGVPVTITMALQDLTKNCDPGAGMAVYLWHCDRDGEYSLYGKAITDQNYLRGVQVAGADGTVSFTSIFPAAYSGRWPHIHFEVYDSLEVAIAGENARLTSQIALPQEACDTVFAGAEGYEKSVTNMTRTTLSSDNVFGDGWDAELATATGSVSSGYDIAITIGVAAKSENAQAAPPAGGGGPGGAGGPGGEPPAMP
ncbi:intradiol ring-cleavage dioxygenase [Williamsia sp. 1135]|uniref:intradiol ring-cleavage dioxygenase n=1 Tax=Williamsia sp. 1135 TaxID=1889262 RepID=UPI000A10DC6D|nr:intradiol ring-cleavage dioxygenase [Williamsia sp. 1135]ORM32514.1 dioxygenase [Williamsia sp. 1135]